jgi:hypothetical protein
MNKKNEPSLYMTIIFIIIIVVLFILYYLRTIKCPKHVKYIKKIDEIKPQKEENVVHVYFRGLPENNQIKYIYKVDSEEGGYKPYNVNILDDSNMTINEVNYTNYESYRKKATNKNL